MTDSDFQFVKIPERLKPILGKPDPGTRMFRRFGTEDDYREWWDAVCEVCGEEASVSPGGVSMYARVSRAGVHKRLTDGRLTAFLFHVVKGRSSLTGREKLDNYGMPYIEIPGMECKAWAEQLDRLPKDEALREAVGGMDYQG